MSSKLPGSVVAALVLAGLTAIIVAVALFPSGVVWGLAYAVGAVGLARLERWGYWLLIGTVATSWVSRATQGHFDFISFGLVMALLLLTPSARVAVFGVREDDANREVRESIITRDES